MANNEELILNVETTNPYVIGAVAKVEQLPNGALITIVDKNGTTTATVLNGVDGTGIASATLNEDYTLTLLFTDGTSTTTASIRGATGESGVYCGATEPTNPDVDVWIDTSGDPYDIEGEIADDVDRWLEEHPEATTTVQDGAITVPKFASGVVDATLTQTGHPADAKATGDAITADRSRLTAVEGAASSLDARVTNLATLTEGSTTGDAELIDARVVGSTTYASLHQAIDTEFTNVKSDLEYTKGYVEEYLLADNILWHKKQENVSGNGNYVSKKIFTISNPSEGDYFCFGADSVSGATASQPFQIKLFDTTDTAIRSVARDNNADVTIKASDISSNLSYIEFILYPAQGTALGGTATYTNVYVLNSGNNISFDYSDALNDFVDDKIDDAVEPVYNVATKTTVERLTVTKTTGYINKSGSVSASDSYYYFFVENLKEGDIVAVRTYYQTSASIIVPTLRFVAAYDGDTIRTAKGAENLTGQYTVPSGISKIAITITSSNPNIESVLLYRNNECVALNVREDIESAVVASKPITVSGNLGVSQTLSIKANAVKKNKDFIFNGKITSFNAITIGQNLVSDNNTGYIVVDTTNLSIYRGSASPVVVAHSLTFVDYISITIHIGENHKANITIMTNGGEFVYETTSTWVGCSPDLYATTDASTILTDCTFSFVCEDVKQPLWIFGDSYVSFNDARWTYWIAELGYHGYLLNGYAGEPTATAMQDLNNLLNYGTPKYIIWALGMNDGDSSGVNSRWKACYDELIALCNKHGITPILCTIPNVPDVDNTYKNAIVTASGYTYINLADAVGALNDTTWYTGMLSSDNLHPTKEGAKALASQVIKDFPYICIK